MDAGVTIYFFNENDVCFSKGILDCYKNQKADELFTIPFATSYIKVKYRTSYHTPSCSEDEDDEEQEFEEHEEVSCQEEESCDEEGEKCDESEAVI